MTDDAVEAPPANPIEEQDPMEAPPPQPAEEEGKSPEEERPGRPGSGGVAPNRDAPDPEDRQPPSTTVTRGMHV